MENCVDSCVHTLKDTWDLGKEGLEQENFQSVLRAAGETETTQENIQNWLELDEGDPGFQLLIEEEIAAVIFFFHLFSSALSVLLNFPFICFVSFFMAVFCLINPDDLSPPQLMQIIEGLLYKEECVCARACVYCSHLHSITCISSRLGMMVEDLSGEVVAT
jgi:hypothetical protein